MSDKPIPERWADRYEHWITRGPDYYSVLNREARQLAEELGAAEAKVRELEQALEAVMRQAVMAGMEETPLYGIPEAALHVTDKAVKNG